MIYTWIGATGWTVAFGWVEHGMRLDAARLSAETITEYALMLEPLDAPPAVATAPTGEAKE